MELSQIQKNLNHIKSQLGNAKLIAVSKYSPVEDVALAYQAGHKDFGENRVQDLSEKANYFQEHHLDHVRWHFIGHLQSNKVKDLFLIPNLEMIHSVDSLKLLHEMVKRKSFLKKAIKVFLQVNTSHEEQKSGFESLEEIENAILYLRDHSDKFELFGLMTMGPIRTENFENGAEVSFKQLFELSRELNEKFKLNLKLSMGMSQDFSIALKYHSDFVRIGSAVFK